MKLNILSAACFIAATNIGIAYLSVPILTGIAGFVPACVVTLLVWAFTLSVALLFAEATLGQPAGANMISISRALAGRAWMVIIAIVFFINMISYLTGYAFFMEGALSSFFYDTLGIHLSHALSGALSIFIAFVIVFFGMNLSCRINFVLLMALTVAFFLTLYQGSGSIQNALLLNEYWEYIFFSVPILFSALGFVGIVPPVCNFLNRNHRDIRLAICLGSFITLLIYLAWQFFVIGSVAKGDMWLIYEEGLKTEKVLELLNKVPNIHQYLNFTVFFSMFTSMIGNRIGIVDFLFDGFKVPLEQRRGWKRALICSFVIVIILPVSLVEGHPFLSVIPHFTAPIGEVLINGVVPIWMVMQARYVHQVQGPQLLPGKHLSLMILGVGIFILIYLEGVQYIRS